MSVYFIADPYDRVKIGFAVDAEKRLRVLQTGNPDPLHLLRVVNGSPAIERWLHRRFAALRISREWFHFTKEMLTVVPPDEVPVCRKPPQQQVASTIGEYFRNADRLGLLTEESRRYAASLLDDGEKR